VQLRRGIRNQRNRLFGLVAGPGLGNRIGNTFGRVAGIMKPPERGVISDLACGGKNLDWLYVAERGRLFRRSVKVTGAAVGSPTKPPQPRL